MKIYHYYAFKTLLCFSAFIVEVLYFGADSTLLFSVGVMSALAGMMFRYVDE
jgi:hypothetical protein